MRGLWRRLPEGFAMPDRDVRLWIPWDVCGVRPRDQHYLAGGHGRGPARSIWTAGSQLPASARMGCGWRKG